MKTRAVGRPWGQWCESATRCRALQERRDLGGRERLAGLHGGLAGDHVQELGQQPVAGRRQGLCAKVLGQVANEPLGDHMRQHRWHAPHQHRIAAERLDFQSELGQSSLCSTRAAASAAVRSTGSGTRSRCDSTCPCATRLRNSSYKIRS